MPKTQWTLATLSFAMLLSSLDTGAANVALPALTEAFTATFREAQWVIVAYLIPLTILGVAAGWIGDRIGHRRLLLSGIVLFTLASTLSGLAPTLGLLVVFRSFQGAGVAVMMTLALAMAGEAFPKGRTGGAMGLLGTMSAIGTAMGPSLGGILVGASGWRAVFLVNLPLGVLAFVLAQRALPPDIPRARKSPPLFAPSLFRDPVLVANLAASALVAAVITSTLVVGPFHLSRGLGLDAARVGLVLSIGPLVAALTALPAGFLTNRFGTARITGTGLLGMAAGSLALFLLPSADAFRYVLPLAVITAGYGLFQTANNTCVMDGVRSDQRGTVSGLLNCARNLGRIAGALVMGTVFTLGSGATDVALARPEAVDAGMRITFGFAAVLVAAATGISSVGRVLGRLGPPHASAPA